MTDAEFIYMGLGAASVLGNAILGWRVMLGKKEKREISPDPLNIQKAPRSITSTEFDPLVEIVKGHGEDIGELKEKISSEVGRVLKTEAEARSRLHEKFNALAADVSAIKSSLKPLENLPSEFNRAIGRIEGVIQRNQ